MLMSSSHLELALKLNAIGIGMCSSPA
ncbi:hypothetical protein L195_g008665, partial [Trifolium pratense]